ncbi:MAG: glycerol kinase [Puniceicoccaceae bacterium]|nr:MAG: glycerol kinase [Puniceicoccaceae bacterium]
MPPVLALDQSTSATKALRVDDDGRIVASASRPHRQHYPRPGWVEHDAEEIWQNTLAVLREVLSAGGPTPARLSITNQRETFVFFHRDGRPAAPAVVWQCRRGVPVCERLHEAADTANLPDRTGLLLDTYFSAPKALALFEANPALRRKVHAGEVLFGTIDAYLIHRLTGGAIHATDATNASRTLAYNLQTGAWDPELCALFDLPPDRLPEIRACSDAFGTLAVDGLPALEIRGVMGDSQASLLAQHCVSPGDVKATFGTGTSLLLNCGDRPLAPADGLVCALAWRLGQTEAFALEGLVNYSAATLSWLIEQLGLFKDVAEAEALATSVPDNGGVVLVPAFAGLNAPHRTPQARGLLTGLSAHSGRAQVARAAYESIALQIADVLDLLRSASGVSISKLRADGGPTRSGFLMDLTAACCGCPLEVNPQPELSPLGAVLAGRLGAGETTLETLAARPPADLRVHPPSSDSSDSTALATLKKAWTAALRQTLAG